MPIPLIELQKRLTIVGKIRLGEKNEKGFPTRLNTWRITSAREELIREAAGLYGGTPQPWQSPVGPEFEVVTTVTVLPVLVMPGYSLQQSYELWEGASKCSRRCDGIEEQLSGKPCLCNSEGEDKCDLSTRLTVALPELTTLLGWRVETKGQNAAHELAGGMQMAEALGGGRPFVPAKLVLTERRGQKDGKAVRYVVPVLDLAVGYAQMAQGQTMIQGRTYTPVAAIPETGVDLQEGLKVTASQTLTRTGRSAAPIGEELVDDETDTPVPVVDESDTPATTVPPVVADPPTLPTPSEPVTEPASAPAEASEADETPRYISEAQRRRLHVVRRKAVVMEDRAKEILIQVTGQPSTSKIPVDLYDRVIAALEAEDTGQDGLL